MTLENKKLLIQDVMARLPYNTKYQIKDEENLEPLIIGGHIKINNDYFFNFIISENQRLDFKDISEFKPCLFPMSSMTEEQSMEFALLQVNTHKEGWLFASDCSNMIHWLNKNHFDYRELISKGLAINATNLNIY